MSLYSLTQKGIWLYPPLQWLFFSVNFVCYEALLLFVWETLPPVSSFHCRNCCSVVLAMSQTETNKSLEISQSQCSVVRAVFKWLSKVITWLRLLRLVIGLKESRQFFNQWEAKPKPITPCACDFSPSLRASYRWLLGIVIGSSRCSFLLWLVGVIALVLVFRQSFENRSSHYSHILSLTYPKL